jgi:hypothetical protein
MGMNPDTDDQVMPKFFADMFAGFSLGISGLTDEVKRLNGFNDDQVAASRRNLPRQIPLIQEAVNGNPATILDFGSPSAGRKWEIRILGAVAVTSGAGGGFVTMATCVQTWYIGPKMQGIVGMPPGVSNPMNIRWQFPSIPNFDNYSGDQIQVLPNEELQLGLTGIPVNPTQIYGIAVVNDMPLYAGRVVSVS